MIFILASTSPYRLQQLTDFGLAVRSVAPLVDEDELKKIAPAKAPKDLARFLAQKKAQSIQLESPHDLVISGDQLLDFEGEILGKPGSPGKAAEQLLMLSGKTHQLITALCVRHKDQEFIHVDTTLLKLRPLTPGQAERYVTHDMTWNCAGSYKIEKSGLGLMAEVKTSDPSAIIGVPLMALTDILLKWEIPLPFFERTQ